MISGKFDRGVGAFGRLVAYNGCSVFMECSATASPELLIFSQLNTASTSNFQIAAPQMSPELLVFEVDGATFAVPTANVREVLRAAALFPLAEYPSQIEGGLNLRGEIVPVVDGRDALSRNRRPMTPNDHIIVLDVADRLVAIRVDRAVELTVTDACPSERPHDGGRWVDCVVNTACGPTAILRVDQLTAVSHPVEAPQASEGGNA